MQFKKITVISIITLTVLSIFSVFLINKISLETEKQKVSNAGSETLTPEEKNVQKQKVLENYGKLPISFEPNKGQTDEQVRFLANGTNYSMFLTAKGSVIDLRAKEKDGKTEVKFCRVL